MVAASAASAQAPRHAHPDSVRIVTADIENFWRAYDRLTSQSTRADSIQTFRSGYFDPATPGLQSFIQERVKDRPSQLGYWMGYQIAEAYYNKARTNHAQSSIC
jgi:hypothetical protein